MTETSLAATKDIDDERVTPKPGSGGIPLPGIKGKVRFGLLLVTCISKICITMSLSYIILHKLYILC